ncbi:MAG: S8/S53 family peptidase [Planctomycetes bacterium]|nr:S8/S53 family peptidase [Planctomycetota bacterium]
MKKNLCIFFKLFVLSVFVVYISFVPACRPENSAVSQKSAEQSAEISDNDKDIEKLIKKGPLADIPEFSFLYEENQHPNDDSKESDDLTSNTPVDDNSQDSSLDNEDKLDERTADNSGSSTSFAIAVGKVKKKTFTDERGNSVTVDAVENEIDVVFYFGVQEKEADKIVSEVGAKTIKKNLDVMSYLISISEGKFESTVKKLQNYEQVRYVGPNAIAEGNIASYLPSELNGNQYTQHERAYLDLIGALEGWNYVGGKLGSNRSKTTLAVVDDAFSTSYIFYDDVFSTKRGVIIQNNDTYTGNATHGFLVTTIAAASHNTVKPVGINSLSEVKCYPISMTFSHWRDTMVRAVLEAQTDKIVINTSLGVSTKGLTRVQSVAAKKWEIESFVSGTIKAIKDALTQKKINKDFLWCKSAGNDSNGYKDMLFFDVKTPDNFINVGAYAYMDAPGYYSVAGNGVDVFVPGPTLNKIFNSNSYPADYTVYPFFGPRLTRWYGGTSFSSPIVAGLVSLMLESNPQLTCQKVKELLIASSKKHSYKSFDGRQYINNVIDMAESLRKLLAPLEVDSFVKMYGGRSIDTLSGVVQANDGGYVVSGMTSSFGSCGYEMLGFKVNTKGDLVWAKTFGGKNFDSAQAICRSSKGGYLLGGISNSFGDNYDLLLVKIGENGDPEWNVVCGGKGYDLCKSIIESDDGGFIVLGYTTSFGSGDLDLLIIKLSKDGQILSSKTYGSVLNDMPIGISKSEMGRLTIGINSAVPYGRGVSKVLKITTDGQILSQKKYELSNSRYRDTSISVFSGTQEGGFILSGNSRFKNSTLNGVLVLKIDGLGRPQNGRIVLSSKVSNATASSDSVSGDILFAGNSCVRSILPFVGRLDSSGNTMFYKNYDLFYLSRVNSLISLEQGGFVVGGYVYSKTGGEMLLMKMRNNGTVSHYEGNSINSLNYKISGKEVLVTNETLQAKSSLVDVKGRTVDLQMKEVSLKVENR